MGLKSSFREPQKKTTRVPLGCRRTQELLLQRQGEMSSPLGWPSVSSVSGGVKSGAVLGGEVLSTYLGKSETMLGELANVGRGK